MFGSLMVPSSTPHRTWPYGVLLTFVVALGRPAPAQPPPPGLRPASVRSGGPPWMDRIRSQSGSWRTFLDHHIAEFRNLSVEEIRSVLEPALAPVGKDDPASKKQKLLVCIRLLADRDPGTVHPHLRRIVGEPAAPWEAKYDAVWALREKGEDPGYLKGLLDSDDDATRAAAVNALGHLPDADIQRKLDAMLENFDSYSQHLVHLPLSKVKLSRDLQAWWDAHTAPDDRWEYLTTRLGWVYEHTPGGLPGERHDPLAVSLSARIAECSRSSATGFAEHLRERIGKGDVAPAMIVLTLKRMGVNLTESEKQVLRAGGVDEP